VSLSGPPGRGKTTAQQLAVSAWSTPQLTDEGLFSELKTTENAIELLARKSSGMVLCLDELALIEGRVVGRMIYSLAGNMGKSRMSAGGTLRKTATWSTFCLLSGEKSLEQKVTSDQGQWSGGMAARFTDIDVTAAGKVPAARLKTMRGIFANYGHAGPRFVEAMIANGVHGEADRVREQVLTAARRLASSDHESGGQIVGRCGHAHRPNRPKPQKPWGCPPKKCHF
jgi:putative DNA primase/helicase